MTVTATGFDLMEALARARRIAPRDYVDDAAGGIGAEILLDEAVNGPALELVPASARPGVVLFSESNSRFLIEVAAESAGRLREIFGTLPLLEIGRTTLSPELRVTCVNQTLIHATLSDLRECWQKPLRF